MLARFCERSVGRERMRVRREADTRGMSISKSRGERSCYEEGQGVEEARACKRSKRLGKENGMKLVAGVMG